MRKVTEIRLYVEGGGTSQGDRALRAGLTRFLGPLHEAARRKGFGFQIVPCGNGNSTFEKFDNASRNAPETHHFLLVDAEEVVQGAPHEHLASRSRDPFPRTNVPEDRYHLMVLMMESWLVADPEALARFYGKDFQRSALPSPDNVERLSKQIIEDALKRATKSTQKGAYHKLHHGPELLGRLDPDRVRRAAPHCDRLFATLERYLAA